MLLLLISSCFVLELADIYTETLEKHYFLLHLVNFGSAVVTTVFIISIIAVLVLVTHFSQW